MTQLEPQNHLQMMCLTRKKKKRKKKKKKNTTTIKVFKTELSSVNNFLKGLRKDSTRPILNISRQKIRQEEQEKALEKAMNILSDEVDRYKSEIEILERDLLTCRYKNKRIISSYNILSDKAIDYQNDIVIMYNNGKIILDQLQKRIRNLGAAIADDEKLDTIITPQDINMTDYSFSEISKIWAQVPKEIAMLKDLLDEIKALAEDTLLLEQGCELLQGDTVNENFIGKREGGAFTRGCDRKSNFGYNCIPDYRGPNQRWDNSNNSWEVGTAMNNNDYRIYDKYINTFNIANRSNKYSLTNQFKNRCSAITDYDDIKTWSKALIRDTSILENKRIKFYSTEHRHAPPVHRSRDDSASIDPAHRAFVNAVRNDLAVAADWFLTIEFYKSTNNTNEYDGNFYLETTGNDASIAESGNYLIKNDNTIFFYTKKFTAMIPKDMKFSTNIYSWETFEASRKFKIEKDDNENILFYSKIIGADEMNISAIKDDFDDNDIIKYEGAPEITPLGDVDNILDNSLSWNTTCNNVYSQNNTYYDDFSIQSSGLINNRNDEIRENIQKKTDINISDEENSYIKKFYNSNELSSLLNYRDETPGYQFQFNVGLRKALGNNSNEAYDKNEGEIPAIFLIPTSEAPDEDNGYVGFGDFQNLQEVSYDDSQYLTKMDSSMNVNCYGYGSNPMDGSIEKDSSAVCLLDYMNLHLEQYQRYLCDKLPNNQNYVTQDNIKTCKKLKNNLWTWTSNKDYTKSKNISYDEFDKWNKLETEKNRFIQNKKDSKEPYFNKRNKIILLIIGILLLLYLVKKY